MGDEALPGRRRPCARTSSQRYSIWPGSADPPSGAGESRGAALIFEKPSNRTRNSTEMAVVGLGGHPVTMQGRRDRLRGAGTCGRCRAGARPLPRRAVGARVFDHAAFSSRWRSVDEVPIVNLLSDRSHPCQALADLLTLRQTSGADYVADGGLDGRRPTSGPKPHPRCAMAGVNVPSGFAGGLPAATPFLAEAARGYGVDVAVTPIPRGRHRSRRRVTPTSGRPWARRASGGPGAVLRRVPVDEELMGWRPPGRGVSALSPGAPGSRGHLVGDRRAGQRGVGAGREPHACVQRPAALAGHRGARRAAGGARVKLTKAQRQHRIEQFIEQRDVTSQGQLVELLGQTGSKPPRPQSLATWRR